MKQAGIVIIFCLTAWVIFAQSCMYFRISDTKAAEYFTQNQVPVQVTYMQASGVLMHFLVTGQNKNNAPTIFFIHGSPGSWSAFQQYLADTNLLKKFRLVAIDRPGFGYSHFGHALNLNQESNIISAIIDSVASANQPFYLVGHSLGGPLCLRLALDNPGKFAGLVLLSAAIDPAQEKPEKWRKIFMNNPLQFLIPGAMRPSNYELWYLKNDLKKMKSQLVGAQLPFIWMLHGNKDNLVPYANTNFAKKYFSPEKLKIITIEGANHFIPWQHYAEIKNVLIALPLK